MYKVIVDKKDFLVTSNYQLAYSIFQFYASEKELFGISEIEFLDSLKNESVKA